MLTTTWSQMAKRALDGVTVWRSAVRRHGIVEDRLGFTAVDFMVVCLLLDLESLEGVTCADPQLRVVLDDIWSADSLAPHHRVLERRAGVRDLRLLLLRESGVVGESAIDVVYGLRRGFALADVAGSRPGIGLRPLSTTSPALWQCGLALLVPEEGAEKAAALVDTLNQTMRGEWIDPLALYERVQQLTAALRGLGSPEPLGQEDRLDRIAELEQELASIKRTAHFSQHELLRQLADREREAS